MSFVCVQSLSVSTLKLWTLIFKIDKVSHLIKRKQLFNLPKMQKKVQIILLKL